MYYFQFFQIIPYIFKQGARITEIVWIFQREYNINTADEIPKLPLVREMLENQDTLHKLFKGQKTEYRNEGNFCWKLAITVDCNPNDDEDDDYV